ncbi:MAG: GNAT family N-acetyltransferase, partial [Bacteroidota bacterium]
CYIGRLIVHPTFQNLGIGYSLVNAIEQHFKHCKKYELFTGHKSEKNLYLYNKLGYKSIREQQVDDGLTLVFLEKQNPERALPL